MNNSELRGQPVITLFLALGSGYLVGRKVLGLPPVLLLGALTGAMTSSPALSLIAAEARSAAPALGYTGTYAFANVFLTVAATLITLL
jgi:putative transport protein